MSIAGELDAADDLADRPQDLPGQHPTRLRRARAGRHPRIDHVDVEREIDRIRSVQGLRDRIGDHGLGAALLDFAHEMPAHALRLHPLEGGLGRPVPAQPDLDEVASLHGTGFDQPAHRGAVAGQDAIRLIGGIGVCVEMDDPDASAAGGARRSPSPQAT